MKNTQLVLPVLLLFVTPMAGQVEHAPTPDQCRADAAVWGVPAYHPILDSKGVEFQRFAVAVMHDSNVTAKMIDARIAELTECEKTSGGGHGGADAAARYAQAVRAYAIAQLGRMAHYMQRHNLTAQFYQEDDQGRR